MAENLYNKLAHPLLYKESKGGMSRKDEMIIDMGHGAALLYWITVACMEEKHEGAQEGGDQGSRFPDSVRNLAGDEVTVRSLNAVANATPDIPSTPQDSTSIDFLLKALADIRMSDASEENIWGTIREKLGFDQHQILGSLPTVPEARFDSKDLEDSPKCHENTRQEVRHTIKSWINDNTAETFFWLHAPAGVGKSTLARTLVDDLRHLQLAAGYFFRRGNDLRNDTSRVFPTIAGQLTRTIPSFANALHRSIGTMDIGTMDKMSLRDQFNTLIYNPLCSIKHIPCSMLIIFDALDECTKLSNIQTILELLARLKDLETFRICIFFSSRNTRLLHNAFQPFKIKMVCREMALHEQSLASTRLEMRAVLKDGLEKVKEQSNIRQDPWPSDEDFNTILSYATSPSPLFIYMSTFLRHINSRDPGRRLQRWLETSERSVSQLDHIYDPIMKSILVGDGDDDMKEPLDQDEIQNLQLLLGFLVLVTRPMSARTLQAFLGMDENKFKATLESLHAVVRVTDDDTPINLIHKSFADYILAMKDEATANFRIDFTWVHGQLAKRCAEWMRQGLRKNICNADDPSIAYWEFDQDMVTKSIPLDLTYACTHWVHHLTSSQKDLGLARAFLEKHLLHWLAALSILGALNEGGIAIGILLSLAQNNSDVGALPGPDIIEEAQILLRANVLMIKNYPLQSYGVCLAREQASSKVKQLFAPSRATRLSSFASIRGGVPALPPGGYEIDMGGRHGIIKSQDGQVPAISQDGQVLAVHNITTIDIADTRTGLVYDRIPGLIKDQAPLKPDTPRILAIDFSNDELSIFGQTADARIIAGDTQSKEEPVLSGSLKAVAEPFERGELTVEGSMAVVTRGTMVYVWNFQLGFDSIIEISSLIEEPQAVNGQVENRITDVSLSAKGPTNWTIALINKRGYIFVWSASQKVGEGILHWEPPF
ncbi:hypothetical protein NW752_011750 [Fusarium irregulare]|uniref:Nephrocystin 3-like N-terminal domain-containing protein n=1 Tax=Fusarium irregulare TaxID=2494466 RepID=A0A9W8PDB6_9HYPO|nr:hypothetical protein NW766_012393 [Fusarium irregulare]KAJ4004653.1 hypothetical protein NW752_011750 [Fusarium irregulare]